MNSTSSGVLVIDAATIAAALPPLEWLAIVADSLKGSSNGEAVQGIRQTLPVFDGEDRGRILSIMFGAVRRPACFGAKVISVYPDNFTRGLDSHRGAVLLFEPDDGALCAILHGGEITAARTAAASAVATDALARRNATCLGVLGYGEQAVRHVDAIALVRPIARVRCWGRDRVKAEAFARRITATHGIPATAEESVAAAIADADIVCTTTSARDPVLSGELLEAGMHLNVVGSSTADYREVDNAAVARSSLWVDFRAMTEVSAGEYLCAKREGAIGPDHIVGEIGALLNGTVRGRRDEQEVTMFKSLGMAAEDLYCAQAIYEIALRQGLGVQVSM